MTIVDEVILYDPNAEKPSADICRENGWGVGTVLESNGYDHCRIRITAIGESAILAATIEYRLKDGPWTECNPRDGELNLNDRTWTAIEHAAASCGVQPASGGRDPVEAARELIEYLGNNTRATGIKHVFTFPPDLLGELASECERLRVENAKLLDALIYESDEENGEGLPRWFSLDDFAPGKLSNTGLAVFEGPFATREQAITQVRESWDLPTPGNPWPGHPVIEPDPAEAAQAEERARIEAAAREEEERARKRARWDQFDAAISRWHDSDSELPVNEYLGITEQQYHDAITNIEAPEGWEPPADLQGEGEPA